MIDICFSDCLADILEEIKDSINSDGILSLPLHLNYGLLDCDIIEEQTKREINTLQYCYRNITEKELQAEYEDLLEANKEALDELYCILKNNTEIRLWLSNNANDRCGLFWFSHIAKNYTNKISTVVCPGYTYSIPNRKPYTNNVWALCDSELLILFSDKTHDLNYDEMYAYSENWERLVKENTNLRILIDDTVVSTNEDFFDNTIIGFVKKEPQTQESIMGQMLGKWQGGCDVAFISKRIEHLIRIGIITVCEEKIDENNCYWSRTISLK